MCWYSFWKVKHWNTAGWIHNCQANHISHSTYPVHWRPQLPLYLPSNMNPYPIFYTCLMVLCVYVSKQNLIVSSAQSHRTYMEKTNLRTDSDFFFLIIEKRIAMHWRIFFFVLFCHIDWSHMLTPILSFCLQRSPAAPLDCASCRVSNHSTDVRGHGALKGPFSGELSDSSATDSAGIQYHSGGLSRQRDRDITPSE